MAKPENLFGKDGRQIARDAIQAEAEKGSSSWRLSTTSLGRVVDTAWRYQFDAVDRAEARKDLREVLLPEIERYMETES